MCPITVMVRTKLIILVSLHSVHKERNKHRRRPNSVQITVPMHEPGIDRIRRIQGPAAFEQLFPKQFYTCRIVAVERTMSADSTITTAITY